MEIDGSPLLVVVWERSAVSEQFRSTYKPCSLAMQYAHPAPRPWGVRVQVALLFPKKAR
jgi:hypothetical protein